MRFFLSLSILLFCHQRSAYGQVEEIDSLLGKWDFRDRPGGVVAVVKDQEVIYNKAFGLADLKKKEAIQLHTSFGLASIAKQFTAMCIALLEEQGTISSDDDIRVYYPEFQYIHPIKVQNLLDHTSGIREGYVLLQLSGKTNLLGKVPGKYKTKDHLIAAIAKEKDLNFPSGSAFAYTNINYILLGDLVERVSGQTLAEFADSAIFRPLKMHNTFFNDQVKSQELFGYFYNGKKYKAKHFTGGVVGDHNLVSTIDDLILWSNNRYDNQLGKKNPKLYDKLDESSELSDGTQAGYGYGVSISSYKGHNQVSHGGDNGIHTSYMSTIPDLKLTVIGLTNSSRYDQVEGLVMEIIDLYLDTSIQQDTTWNFDYISLSEDLLSSKAGLYYTIGTDGLGRIRKVTYENGELFISGHSSVKGLKLDAISEQYFVAKNSLEKFIHVNFSGSSAGDVILHEKYEELVDETFIKRGEVSYQNRDFLGEYKNESTGAVLKIKSSRDGLKAKRGIINLPLIALKRDVFYAIPANALFEFRRDGEGQVVSLIANASDFRNFRFKKIK